MFSLKHRGIMRGLAVGIKKGPRFICGRAQRRLRGGRLSKRKNLLRWACAAKIGMVLMLLDMRKRVHPKMLGR